MHIMRSIILRDDNVVKTSAVPGNIHIIESQTKEAKYDSDWSEKRVKNQQSASVVVGCEETNEA